MPYRAYRHTFLLLLCAAGISSCSYTVEQSHQDIEFITPGAEYAACDVYVNKLRYQVHPPQKINIMKSSDDMEIRCVAPGNRIMEMTVPSRFDGRTLWGTPAGMAWDYAASAMHDYPSVIAIDFSQEVNVPNPPPRHNSPDIVQPEDYDLEEYLPGEPRLNSDRHKKAQPIRRRDDIQAEEALIEDTPIDVPKPVYDDKGNLVAPAPQPAAKATLKPVQPAPAPDTASSLTPLPESALEDEMPAATNKAPAPAAGAKPVPLFPGE